MQNQYTQNWQKVKIGDIADIKGGKRLPKGRMVQDMTTSHPYIRVTDMNRDGLDTTDIKYISEDVYKRIKKYTISDEDLYISIAGTIGLVGKIPVWLSGANLTENAAKITNLTNNANRDYLMYFLRSTRGQEQISARAGGSSQPKLALFRIADIDIRLPEISMQKQIAGILSTYDHLIENNTRRIKILEDMAQAIYREWFVHFRFPGHEKVKMIDSGTEFGKIPEGWKVSTLGYLVDIRKEGIDPALLSPRTIYVGLEHLPRNTWNFGEFSTAKEAKSNKLKFYVDDVLFGNIRPYFHKVLISPTNGICSSDIVVLMSKDKKMLGVVFSVVYSKQFISQATTTSKGTKMPRADWDALLDYKVVLPPDSIASDFDALFGELKNMVHKLVASNNKLRQARDLLMPKLVTGEIQL